MNSPILPPSIVSKQPSLDVSSLLLAHQQRFWKRRLIASSVYVVLLVALIVWVHSWGSSPVYHYFNDGLVWVSYDGINAGVFLLFPVYPIAALAVGCLARAMFKLHTLPLPENP